MVKSQGELAQIVIIMNLNKIKSPISSEKIFLEMIISKRITNYEPLKEGDEIIFNETNVIL